MRITFFSRYNEKEKWGGDVAALHGIAEGMRALGCEAEVIGDLSAFKPSTLLFLSNTCLDQREQVRLMQLIQQPFGLIGFHEDRIKYDSMAFGFHRYIQGCLEGSFDEDIPFSLEALLENPHLAHYYGAPPRKTSLQSYEVLRAARLCIASSATEARTMVRDCPTCTPHVVHWAPGAAVDFSSTPTEEFLALTGLSSQSYILQVGRLEERKHQLGSILATRDLDRPLVFIATKGTKAYERTCVEAILKWRKAPTFIISETLEEMHRGPLHILPMPNSEKLSLSMLQSAYAHAALYLHPAFMELPGYTYFESVACGTPTIASSWTTIGEYFSSLGDRIEYCLPYAIEELTQIIKKKLGVRYSAQPSHPIFQRTHEDVAREILALIDK